jgi:hypothetical protein
MYPKHFLALPSKELIIRYRSIMNGYANYFTFVNNKTKLSRVHWILRESLLKAIGSKKDLSRSEVVRRFGLDIVLKITRKNGETVSLDFRCPMFVSTPSRFLGSVSPRDPLSVVDWKISTVDNMEQGCAKTACGSFERVEMHHVKHVKTINPRLSSFDKLLARINRKQVPLCKSCHLKVHLSTYIGLPLRHFYYIPFQGEPK